MRKYFPCLVAFAGEGNERHTRSRALWSRAGDGFHCGLLRVQGLQLPFSTARSQAEWSRGQCWGSCVRLAGCPFPLLSLHSSLVPPLSLHSGQWIGCEESQREENYCCRALQVDKACYSKISSLFIILIGVVTDLDNCNENRLITVPYNSM